MLNDFPDTHFLSIIFTDKLWNLMVPIQRYTVFLLFLISYIYMIPFQTTINLSFAVSSFQQDKDIGC